jgi:hypothetical protein
MIYVIYVLAAIGGLLVLVAGFATVSAWIDPPKITYKPMVEPPKYATAEQFEVLDRRYVALRGACNESIRNSIDSIRLQLDPQRAFYNKINRDAERNFITVYDKDGKFSHYVYRIKEAE